MGQKRLAVTAKKAQLNLLTSPHAFGAATKSEAPKDGNPFEASVRITTSNNGGALRPILGQVLPIVHSPYTSLGVCRFTTCCFALARFGSMCVGC